MEKEIVDSTYNKYADDPEGMVNKISELLDEQAQMKQNTITDADKVYASVARLPVSILKHSRKNFAASGRSTLSQRRRKPTTTRLRQCQQAPKGRNHGKSFKASAIFVGSLGTKRRNAVNLRQQTATGTAMAAETATAMATATETTVTATGMQVDATTESATTATNTAIFRGTAHKDRTTRLSPLLGWWRFSMTRKVGNPPTTFARKLQKGQVGQICAKTTKMRNLDTSSLISAGILTAMEAGSQLGFGSAGAVRPENIRVTGTGVGNFQNLPGR